jgi:hypothetical protein
MYQVPSTKYKVEIRITRRGGQAKYELKKYNVPGTKYKVGAEF